VNYEVLLFEFVRAFDDAHFRCELSSFGDAGGVEVRFLMNGRLFVRRRYYSRTLALHWAKVKREQIENVASDARFTRRAWKDST
jgi:hypothetical protein